MGELVAAGGQGRTLTDRQKRLLNALIAGKSDQEAWELAGYADRREFSVAVRSVSLQAALLAHRMGRITGGMAEKALSAIEDLITNEKTPSATRLAAAKWTLEQAGHTGQTDDGRDVPLHEMTAQQLETFMAKAQAVVDGGGEGPAILVVPDSGALPSPGVLGKGKGSGT